MAEDEGTRSDEGSTPVEDKRDAGENIPSAQPATEVDVDVNPQPADEPAAPADDGEDSA
jgi:hypothetical protein